MLPNGKLKLEKKVISLVSNYSGEESNEEDDTSEDENHNEESHEISTKSLNNELNDKNDKEIDTEVFDEKPSENSFGDAQIEEQKEGTTDALKLTIENGFHPGCENIKLPEAPKEQCSQRLQEKIAKVYTRMTHYGYNINDDIQNNKKFKNPSIYEKLIEHYDIDEFGSSFPSYIPDLKKHGYMFYDELDEIQRQDWAKRDKERKEKSAKAEIISGIKRSNN